jgi:prepilin-type N-terminal cleavage/methylation domain-containing protein
MLSKRNKNNDGFTIIEVLIVLAIAALILLIVFLAVPALQRNARNTQRTSDVSALLSGVSEFSSDNNGTTPTGATYSAATHVVTYTDTGVTGVSSVATAKLGFYTSAPTMCVTTTAGGTCAVPTTAPGINAAEIIIGATCTGDAPTGGATATARSVVVYYSSEQSGGAVPECIESGA